MELQRWRTVIPGTSTSEHAGSEQRHEQVEKDTTPLQRQLEEQETRTKELEEELRGLHDEKESWKIKEVQLIDNERKLASQFSAERKRSRETKTRVVQEEGKTEYWKQENVSLKGAVVTRTLREEAAMQLLQGRLYTAGTTAQNVRTG